MSRPQPSPDLTAREAALFTLFAQAQLECPWVDQLRIRARRECGEDDQAFGALCTNLVRKGLLSITTDNDPGFPPSQLFSFTEAGFDLAEALGVRVDRSRTYS